VHIVHNVAMTERAILALMVRERSAVANIIVSRRVVMWFCHSVILSVHNFF